jgi:putative PEP-CTERM system histidine kinase
MIHLPVSRRLLVSTTALVASGVYFLAAAAIAYMIRGLGWGWGPVLQVMFLIGAALVLVTLISSTSLRHGSRRFIERNLFTFAYDYRREWLRLVDAMADPDDDLPLNQRALKATADLVDADGGSLFLRGRNHAFAHAGSWNIALRPGVAPPPVPQSLLRKLSAARTALVLDQEGIREAGLGAEPELGAWLQAFREPWIALALLARNDLVGVILVTRPRLARPLSWEDLDLLSIFAHQLGSYITVENLARHVAETEHFERMSKQVTFVAHDLKNLISQLSLILQQARQHADNPAFVKDSFATVGDAVEKMTALMTRVREGAKPEALKPVDLQALAEELKARGRVDDLAAVAGEVTVAADPAMLLTLLDHMIANARDASPEDGRVRLSLQRDGPDAVLEVVDRGVGMDPAFVATELFKPFASTKEAGFGIGMYQCREWIERWQGRLLVESAPGRGTTVRIILPLSDRPADAGDDRHPSHTEAA